MAAWTYCLVLTCMFFHSSGLLTAYPTTLGPPTTTKECRSGEYTFRDCYSYECFDGHWQPFELQASKECCIKYNNPIPLCFQLHPELGSTPMWFG